MELTKETKLSDLLSSYPWLLDEAVRIDVRFKILNTPIGKMLLKKATIEELSKKAGLEETVLIDMITELIATNG